MHEFKTGWRAVFSNLADLNTDIGIYRKNMFKTFIEYHEKEKEIRSRLDDLMQKVYSANTPKSLNFKLEKYK